MSSLSTSQVIQAYRRYAPWYDWLFGRILEPGRRALARRVTTLAPERILEVGVGTGLMLARYPREAEVVGVDISAEMIRRAQARATQLPGRRIHLLVLDAETMPFPDGSFDCVTLPYVLSVTPRPEQLVQELRRVCRPGGTIFILNHFSGGRFWWFMERAVRSLADKVGFRSDFRLEDQVLKYDWTVVSVQSVNFMGLSKLVEIRND
jgi:phosphatidylethanolamine/phosphatidyl-N-methylethanolamine N-methyltransferase